MIYSFQAFQCLGVFCDKKEVLQFKIKAVKDPKESENLEKDGHKNGTL